MIVDRFDRPHTTSSRSAVEAFEAAILAVAAHRPEAADALAQSLDQDPALVSAWALKGFGALILGREELLAPAAAACAEAEALLARHGGGTPTEASLVHALSLALDGRFRTAAGELETHLDDNPADLLALKLAQSLRFMAGDGAGMLAATETIVPRWTTSMAGAGFAMGCHAFGLEEAGRYREAEAMGTGAVALEPHDSWGLHAVSHVHEMEGRTGEGIEFLERGRTSWSGCNNFRFHMAWHLALFHLETGRVDRALAIYDEEVRPAPTDDFRDVANAASLLWRLRLEGIEVGARWEELAAIGRRRRHQTTLVFATLHNLLALVGAGDHEAASDVLAALQRRAGGGGDQSDVAARVGLDLAGIVTGLRPARRGDCARLARELPLLGGSNAQRDVFLRTLMALAPRHETAVLLDWRRRLKREDRFVARLRQAMRGHAERPGRTHRHLAVAAPEWR
jgi:tetratricopeptide (TPR) repeat protein